MKKSKTYLLLILILIGGLFFVVIFKNNSKKTDSLVLFSPSDTAILAINEVKVDKQEYLLHLKKELAITYNHFYLEYGANNHKEFWTTTYGEEKPIEYIKKRTNKKLLDSKIIHALAVENNIISAFNFNEFTQQWQAYNKERQVNHESGQVVYGQVFTTISDYYFYLLSNLEIRLAKKLKQEKFSPNATVLKNYYETIKQNKFSYVEQAEIEQFGFSFEDISYKKAIDEIEGISKKIKNGALAWDNLKKEFPKAIFKNRTFLDTVPIYGEDNPDQILKEITVTLAFGEVKTVKTQEGVYLIKLLKPLEKEYHSFEKRKELVLGFYQEEKYKAYILERKKKAVITTNNSVYDFLSSEDFK